MLDDSKKILEILKDINNKLNKIGKKLGEDKIQSSIKIEKQSTKKSSSLTSLIIQMKEEGFFDKPKTLQEITEKLGESGWHYPKSSITHPLQRLLRKGKIGRIAVKGKWAYVKR